MRNDLIELYSDYLLSSYGNTTATGLSDLLDGAYSHDQFTRLLSTNDFSSRTLWQFVKPVVREIENPDGVLIFDDTIQEKAHSKDNGVIAWHFDHTKNRSVKGVNVLNALYHAGEASTPVAYEVVEKPFEYCDIKTKKVRRRSEVTKNEQFRDMVQVCCQNALIFRYVLADSWFSSKENMNFVHRDCSKHFLIGYSGAFAT